MSNNISFSNENFAEPVNSINISSKKTPQNPMRYFWIVSFVAFIIKDLVSALPSYLYSLLIMFSSMLSSLTDFNIEISERSPLFDIFDSVFSSFTIILFGVLFVKYIINKTTFNGDITKYRFIYYSWSFAVGGFVLDIMGLVSSLVLLKVQNNYATVSGSIITLVLSSVVSIVSFGTTILAAYLCARLLNSASLSNETNQFKELRLLAIGTTISTFISLIVFIIRIIVLSDFSIFTTISTILSKIITVAVIWIVATVKPKDENGEKVLFTIIPIIAICDSIIYSIIDSLII